MGQLSLSHDTNSTVLCNGKIYQLSLQNQQDAVPVFAEAMLIADGVIQHVGSNTDKVIKDAVSLGATVKDLEGKTVLSSFMDGHIHLLLLGQSLKKVSLDHCKSLEDIRSAIKEYARTHPDVRRIFARGWMHSMTPDGVDTSLLDDLDPRPIFVDTKDLHTTWCNTKGLKEICDEMNLSPTEPDPAGGTLQRDKDGRLNGVFNESAVFNIIWPFVARVASMDEKKDAIRGAISAFNAVGYTGLIDMAMDNTIWDPLIALREQEGLGAMRVAAYWLIKPNDSLDAVLEQVDEAARLSKTFNASNTPDCRIIGVKVICDGIVDACTASLTEPYANSDNPDPFWSEDFLNHVVARAHAAGLQVALHAIGDRTIKMVIDVLERNTDRSLRPRVEHLELASERDAQRLGQLGITASIQPVHSDPAILRAWPKLLGPDRCKRAFAYREFADGGANLALGSDAPTAPHEPIPNLYVGTTRRSYREPELETTVNPEFALTVYQAVSGATHGSAYSCFADKWTGRLEPGLKADFVICDLNLTPDELIKGVVKETWFEGKMVYKA